MDLMHSFSQGLEKALDGYDLSKPEDAQKFLIHFNDCLYDKGMSPREILHVPEEFIYKLHSAAYALYEDGKYLISYELFNKLMLLEPQSSVYALGAAACLDKLELYDVAIKTYGYSFLNNVEDPIPLYHAAECSLKIKDFAQAKTLFEQVVTVAGNKNHLQPLKEKCLLLLKNIQNTKK